jgi:hypothetical protein
MGEATKRALVIAGAGESLTGLALLLAPSLVGDLLFGMSLTGVAAAVARVAGIALIAFGVACWPGTPLIGMLIYNAAVALYLAYLGLVGDMNGILLWPAVVLHVVLLTALLARTSGGNSEWIAPPSLAAAQQADEADGRPRRPQSIGEPSGGLGAQPDERALCSKLVSKLHLSVPERQSLPNQRARFSVIVQVVRDSLDSTGFFPFRYEPGSTIGEGAVIESRDGALWLHEQHECGVGRLREVESRVVPSVESAVRAYIDIHRGSPIDGVEIDFDA